MTWLILWIPFVIAAGIMFFLLKRPRLAGMLATLGMFTCFFLSMQLLSQFPLLKDQGLVPAEASLPWITLGKLSIEFGILFNGLTLLMLLIVTGIGSLIFLYSTSYMEKDESYARYFACLSFFTFSMIGIVLSNNLIQIFIFWELVGLSSYLLIGFWFEKPEASTAGKKAFLTTRVGDVGMMLGILLLFGFLAKHGLETFNFLKLQDSLGKLDIPSQAMTLLTFLIFLGVVGKSAQVPLHVWLPDAMEGPTPVSALIHAATMVAAGIFLIARLFFLFLHSPETLQIIAWTGGVTAFLAATVAVTQNDIKKVLAYSTLSQLGYMVMALGLRSSEAGMFHLTTHAFFKALLFLGAGSLIHALRTQDIWQMPRTGKSSLFLKMPVTALTFLIGSLALMGIPPLSGYFSKEEILTMASTGPTFLFLLALATVFLTAFYMGRVLTVVFLGGSPLTSAKLRGGSDVLGGGLPSPPRGEGWGEGIHESGWRICIPLILLAVLSVFGGYLPIRELLPDRSFFEESHTLSQISITLAAAGFLLAFFLYRLAPKSLFLFFQNLLSIPKSVLQRKYFFDDFYDWGIRTFQENTARFSDAFERQVIVKTAVNGTAHATQALGNLLRKLQTGVVQFYAFLFTAGLTILILVFIFWRNP